ncbi:hypothetical protein ACOCJ4_04265 [Knoellia sp. CPCC 206435]|uniref:hypothetical protein n=1 Tax=Knoellia terrae TaxID=3404797 RepID=UPI003B435FB4
MNSILRRAAGSVVSTAAIAVGLVVVAPAASAQNCIASGYSNGYRSWCAPAAGGTHFRTVTTCRDAWRPAQLYTVAGSWEVQGGDRWSYALCRSGDSPTGVTIQKGS